MFTGKQKGGEKNPFKAATPHCCIRTSWVFSPFGKNFLNTIIQKLEAQSPLRVVEDQFARPTSGLDLARAVIQLLLETPLHLNIGSTISPIQGAPLGMVLPRKLQFK